MDLSKAAYSMGTGRLSRSPARASGAADGIQQCGRLAATHVAAASSTETKPAQMVTEKRARKSLMNQGLNVHATMFQAALGSLRPGAHVLSLVGRDNNPGGCVVKMAALRSALRTP